MNLSNNNPNYFKGKKSKFNKNYKKESTNYALRNQENSALSYNYIFQNQNEMGNLYNNLYDPEKDKNSKNIICIVQKGSINNKLIGVSYIQPGESGYSLEKSSTIYSGDYSTYDLDSFELFLSNLQPDLIFLHCAFDSKLKEIFKFFESKVRFIQSIHIQYIEIKNILYFYFKNALEEEDNEVRINTKIAKVLDTLSEFSYSAFYTILMIVLKSISIESEKLPSLNFEKILFEEILFVSKKTQRELKIFEEKLHPSFVKGIGRSKEGLSIFSLFNKCVTSQGKKLMKNFFLFPSKNYKKINQRLDCITDFISLKNHSVIKMFLTEMKNVKDLEKILNELNKFMINFKIWNSLFYSLESILKIFDLFKNNCINFDIRGINKMQGSKFKLLTNLYNRIDKENVVKIYNFLKSCLDFMKEEFRPKIKIGINEDLDLLRKEYNELDEILSKYAIDYSKKIPKNSFMEKFMYVFLPQLGYMFAVEKSEKYYKFLSKVNEIVEAGEEGKIEINRVIGIMKVKVESNDADLDLNLNNNIQINNSNMQSNNSPNNFKPGLNSNNSYKIKQDEIDDMPGNRKTMDNIPYSLSMLNEDHNLLTFQNKYEFHNSSIINNPLCNNLRPKIPNKPIKEAENIIKEDTDENKSDEDELNLDEVNNIEDNIEFKNFEETILLNRLIFKDLNIIFQFHSDEIIYFKNELTAILDNQFGDLSARITDIENAIFREISKQIIEFEKDIQLTNEFIANLDVFLQFFIMTEKLNLYKPITIDNNKEEGMMVINPNENNKLNFSFIEGRNLITELVNDMKYIKNSFNSNDKSIFIITGNVSSGKSVFLRKIGMLAYLSHIGSFVPAKNLNICLFDRILSNIEIIESSLDNLSGFTVELKEIKSILEILSGIKNNKDIDDGKNSTSNTLVLLDDPFKRTSSHNKNCLLAGTLSYLINLIKNENLNAKIFITTSFESRDFLIENKIVDDKIVGLYEMKTQVISEGNKNLNNFPKQIEELNILNFYELKEVEFNSLCMKVKNENSVNSYESNNLIQNNNINLLLAKENGLDNSIFFRAIEISNVLSQNKKIFPDLTKILKTVENLKNQGNIFKAMNENIFIYGDLLDRLNNIIDN